MKISTRGRYGIRLMLALALNYNNGTIPLKTIAKDQGISEKYLEQIINPLTKSCLVQSFRGAQGGYMLTNPPEATTVGEILRVLEGSLSPWTVLTIPTAPIPTTAFPFPSGRK